MTAVIVSQEKPLERVSLGDYTLDLRYAGGRQPGAAQQPGEPGFALVIGLGKDEYLLAGAGVNVTATAHARRPPRGDRLGRRGAFVDGHWVRGRRLNGDENGGGSVVRLARGNPQIVKFHLYSYP